MAATHPSNPSTTSSEAVNSYALAFPPALAAQINFMVVNFGHVGNLLNQFFLQNFGILKHDDLKTRAVAAMSHYTDIITEFESLSEAMLEKYIPLTVVECITTSDAPIPEPVTLQISSSSDDDDDDNNNNQSLLEPVPQRRLTTTVPPFLSQPYLFEIKQTDATDTIDVPYTVQFTPTASASGNAPVDNALCVDVKSASEYPHRLIQPSQYLSATGPSFPKVPSTAEYCATTAAAASSVSPPQELSNSVGGSTAVPILAEDSVKKRALDETADEGVNDDTLSTERSSSSSTKKLSTPKKQKQKQKQQQQQHQHNLNTQAPEHPSALPFEPPTETLAASGLQMTGSRPFHHHDVWPRPPSSTNPRALTRRGAFYHKSHPKLWWEDKWGEKPSEKAIVTIEDCLPPWAGGYPEPDSGSGSGSRSGTATTTGTKGKNKASPPEFPETTQRMPTHEELEEEEEDGAEDGCRHSRPSESRAPTGSHWSGFTKTIRSLAASVKSIGRDGGSNEASSSSSSGGGTAAATDPSSGSGSSSRSTVRSQSKKRRREDDGEEGEGDGPHDSNDDSVFWSVKKRVKRSGRK